MYKIYNILFFVDNLPAISQVERMLLVSTDDCFYGDEAPPPVTLIIVLDELFVFANVLLSN